MTRMAGSRLSGYRFKAHAAILDHSDNKPLHNAGENASLFAIAFLHRLTGETKRTALILATSTNFSAGKRPTNALLPVCADDKVNPNAFS